MRADNTAFIVAAARQRHEATLRRAHDAIRRLDQAGAQVSFQAVARAADVSRAWLYRQPGLRGEIERLRRDRTGQGRESVPPSAQRASNDSLQRRLEAAIEEIRRLKKDNQSLRDQIARLHGQRRAGGANLSSKPTP